MTLPGNPAGAAVLAVCRDQSALRSVLRRTGVEHRRLVISSDDLGVHETAKRVMGIRVVFLGQMESLFDVAPQVLELLKAVNAWLARLADDRHLPKEFLYWVQHVEGGDTTQRILDAVLEARSCLAILNEAKPSQVLIGAASRPYWEDEVLVACAAQRGIPVRRLKTFTPAYIVRELWLTLRPIAVAAKQSLMTLDALLRRRHSGVGGASLGRYVAIQMCTRSVGHFHTSLPLVRAFERLGLKVVLVTFIVGRMAMSLRAQGYRVVELEAWVTLHTLVRSWCAAVRGLWRARRLRAQFLVGGLGGNYAPLVRSVLLASVRSFIIAELPQLLRLDAACRRFFPLNPPVAARLWTNLLYHGVVTYRAMAGLGIRPLLFRQVGLDILPNPYMLHVAPIDLYFCASDAGRERLRSEGRSSARILVCGVAWRHHVEEFAARHTAQQSRAELGIPAQAKLIVFCDAQVVLKGYFSAVEQALLVQTVVEFAERHDDVYVILKPHPTDRPAELEAVFSGRGAGRAVWMPANSLPHSALNAAHVVLTKISTMAAEVMLLGIPSICVLLDRDKRWAIYEDAVDYAWCVDELTRKLEMLRDARHYAAWAESLRGPQARFAERHFPRPEMDGFEFVAGQVKEALQ